MITAEGVTQDGPLSPYLFNVVPRELDAELAQRGLRFVNYPDDGNSYDQSERAGHRVMVMFAAFITRRLRLMVNPGKSAVVRPETRHFLRDRPAPKGAGAPEVWFSVRGE